MNRVAIVVQRCHSSVVGGSESLAWQYATLLRDTYEVDVLTTTAVDIQRWTNDLQAGTEVVDGINVRRFTVTVGRTPGWEPLLGRLSRDYDVSRVADHSKVQHLPWSLSLQEEFIRKQGPFSEPMMAYLRQHWSDYKTILFVTYLYPTTYFGLFQIPKFVGLIAPTLHDEPTAYLSAFKHAAHRARGLVWLTDAECRVGTKLWGDLPGRVVGMSVETGLRQSKHSEAPYLMYSGRIDPNKGSVELFSFFQRFKKSFPSNLKLVLTGKDDLAVPEHPDIEFRGFVSEEEKLSLMAGAKAFVIPSANESFSIVTLEAMAQQTPVLARNRSEVLVDHVERSGGGCLYGDYESFASNLQRLLTEEGLRHKLGNRGREYVLTRFTAAQVRSGLEAVIDSCTELLTERPGLVLR